MSPLERALLVTAIPPREWFAREFAKARKAVRK